MIEMKNIVKRFGGVTVLKGASFTLKDGEIHALVGENGAGKSTLMNCLTGTLQKDGGLVFIDGQEVFFSHSIEAEKAGIVFIRQELNVFPTMTVEENLFLNKEICSRFSFVDQEAMRSKAREVLANLGSDIDVSLPVSRLSVGQQQMLEIARALLANARVLIMDEPTAALTTKEVAKLFEIILKLKKDGVSIVYISHRMEEIFELCDRITVLRDGSYVGTEQIEECDLQKVIKMMIGRDMGERFPKEPASRGEVLLEVQNLTKQGLFSDVSFTVHSGEILGVAGLMGAGRTEIMKTIFGSIRPDSGKILIKNRETAIHSPSDAKKAGIGYITEDRKTEGLFLSESIRKNISLNNLKKILGRGKFINKKKEQDISQNAINRFMIKSNGVETACINLSGGNQQKVVFAKWLENQPQILILDEPTRGVDIAAKKEIYSIMNELVQGGTAIIMVSSELPEVMGMSDRIMVIHEGAVAGIVPIDEANREKIMMLATGGHE